MEMEQPEAPASVRPPSVSQLLQPRAKRTRWLRFSWLFGVLILAALVSVVLQYTDIEQFGRLIKAANPEWLLLAGVTQAGTYVCAALVWGRTLGRAGYPQTIFSLLRLGVAKLFTDQAMPSGGLSGTLLVVRGLGRRNIPLNVAMAALLVGLVSFYAAYLTVVIASLGVLWWHHQVNPLFLAGVTAFASFAVLVPAAVLWLRRWANGNPPRWLTRLPHMATLLDALSEAPADLLRSPTLLIETSALQLAVFVCDGLTFWLVFRALGQTPDFWIPIVSFVMASVAASIGPDPIGLGTFEAGAVGALSLLGMPVATGLAATLVMRGLTFWLPMAPGIWLARRELG